MTEQNEPTPGLRPCGYCARPCYGKHGWHYDRGLIEVCYRCHRAFLRLTREGRG